jgi:membrane associated rhomboid family serine protease
LVVVIIVVSIRALVEEKVKAPRAKVGAQDAAIEIESVQRQIETVGNRRRIAAFIFLFITGGAGLAFISMVSGPGAGPDRMFDGLILIPIVALGAIGGLISGLVWLVTWLELKGLIAEYAVLIEAMKPNQPTEPLSPSRGGSS